MNSEESLAWLYSTQHFGIKLGLDNIRRLLAELGNPERALAIIHVAGTNGKGSTCAMLDSISRASGRRTGLYTSPHLVHFGERIRVDGAKISSDDSARIISRIRDLTTGWEQLPTFFEVVTALALTYFAEQKCELVVLETGMGGRLDATNATLPRASVITPIALDHTQWLGDTLAKIATEKAGIIKPGVPVVSAPQEPEATKVLKQAAAVQGSSIQFVEDAWSDGEIGLRGAFQRQNAAVAIAALQAAGVGVTIEEIRMGLRDVRWPGRFQMLEGGVVLDGGHNPQACHQLVANWREEFGEEKATLIFGALADKDYAEMLKIIRPIVKRITFVPVKSERACDPGALAHLWPAPAQVATSLPAALASCSDRPLLIAGSLFLVGEACEVLGVDV